MSLVLPIYRAQAAGGVHIAVARFLDALFYFPSFLEKLMLNKWTRGFLAAVLGLGLVGTSLAEERGTKDEAVAMTSAAVEHVKKVGREQAFKDFTEDKATWTKKDLYVMAYNHEGTCIAHGANGKLVGKNLINLKDADGKVLVNGIFASVPYCVQLLEGPYIETNSDVVAAFRPKSARRETLS